MLHAAEDGANDIYNIYAQRIRENAQYSVARDRIKGQYQAAGRKVSDDTLDSEVSAEILRKAMPKTAEDYDRLIRRVEGNPTLHDRMYNAVRNLRIKMYAMGGKVFTDPDTGFKIEYSELLNMEKTLEDALMGLRGAELGGGEPRLAIKSNDITVSTKDITDIAVDTNKARTDFIAVSKGFPKSVINIDTDSEIGISRKGIDKFLSGRLTKEKYASGYKIPELIENAKKVGESEYNKDKDNIYGYEYYESPIKIDGNEYIAHIRVRNTNMGDRYYGHTISKNVDEIKIEPTARTFEENSTIQPVYAYDSTEVPSNFVAQRPGSKKDPSSATSKDSIPKNTDDVKYRLKTNQDMNVYGRNVIDDLNAYNRKRGYGSAFNDLKNGILPDVIRQSWRLFENGEVADGRKLLYSGGEEIAQKVHHKKGETDHIIATDFVEHFTELYKQSRTIKAYEGRLDASTKDITETGVDVPRYVAELTTKNLTIKPIGCMLL